MKSIFGIAGIAIVILTGHPVSAQDEFIFWPNANYDPAIPSVEDVLGYKSGERITWHRDAVRYFEALEAAAPGRISVDSYAESWEGRELIYVVLSSAENMSRIDEVKAGMQRLADPVATTRAEAEAIIGESTRRNLAVLWRSWQRNLIHRRSDVYRIPLARIARRWSHCRNLARHGGHSRSHAEP